MVGADVAAAAGGGMMKWLLILSGAALIAVAGYGIYGPEVDTTPKILDVCVTHSDSINHYHPWIFIKINGEIVNIPEGTGVTEECMYPIHTHSPDGKLHIEIPSSNPLKITVEDFFTVWGSEFNENQILDYSADENHEIIMTVYPTKEDYVNGTNGVVSTDYEKHVFTSVDADGDGIADGDDTVVLIEYKEK
ncbi:MAG: hypothetical protein CMA27_06875 [Euryarchaeota archaeon]|nr:hypothetical protein [Euryarchaeota archaeon]